jgi:hypothetical protein
MGTVMAVLRGEREHYVDNFTENTEEDTSISAELILPLDKYELHAIMSMEDALVLLNLEYSTMPISIQRCFDHVKVSISGCTQEIAENMYAFIADKFPSDQEITDWWCANGWVENV